MKRIWSILLTMTVALTLLCPMTAYAATGEGNIDGGGGNLGGRHQPRQLESGQRRRSGDHCPVR